MAPALARWLLAGSLLFSPRLSLAAAQDPPDEADLAKAEAEAKAKARAEVQAAGEAFAAGDYPQAISHYEAAMAILPASKLHYNLGVCHQRLALRAESPEDRTRHRDQAIEHYNAYLVANPQADDRFEIADTIRELGGTPATMPTLIEPVFGTGGDDQDGESDGDAQDGESDGDAEPLDADSLPPPEPQDPPQAQPQEKRWPSPNHGRFVVGLFAGTAPNLIRATAVDAPALVGIELQGGGFVGHRRRFLIAAHSSLYSGAALRADGLAFYGYSLGLLFEQTFVLGRERDAALIGVGALAAVTGQSLQTRADVPPPLCSIDRGAQVAGRTGGLIAPRIEANLLLGPRRRSMLGVHIQPGVAIFGDGPSGPDCSAGTTPWTNVGVRRRWQFQLLIGANYGFRF